MTYLRSQNISVVYKTTLHTTVDDNLYNIKNNIPQVLYENEVNSTPKIDMDKLTSRKNTIKPTLAYVTYHSYYENQPLSTLACSDGSNGLITKTGYTTLTNELWPYVTSWSDISWNSPKCGSCINLKANNGKSINVIAIDGCGKQNGGTHFDVSEISFLKLFGNTNSGSGYVSYSIVDSKNCGINY